MMTETYGLTFCVERRARGLRGDTAAWIVHEDGFARPASPEEEALWNGLCLAAARVVELETDADAQTETAEASHEEAGGRKKRR